jgi:hypothetical protein
LRSAESGRGSYAERCDIDSTNPEDRADIEQALVDYEIDLLMISPAPTRRSTSAVLRSRPMLDRAAKGVPNCVLGTLLRAKHVPTERDVPVFRWPQLLS